MRIRLRLPASSRLDELEPVKDWNGGVDTDDDVDLTAFSANTGDVRLGAKDGHEGLEMYSASRPAFDVWPALDWVVRGARVVPDISGHPNG